MTSRESKAEGLRGFASGLGILVQEFEESVFEITRITPQSPAAYSGQLAVGDRVERVNGERVSSSQSFVSLAQGPANTLVSLEIRMVGESEAETVHLMRAEGLSAEGLSTDGADARAGLGARVVHDEKGMKVCALYEGGSAYWSKLKIGDLICAVDGHDVRHGPPAKVLQLTTGEGGTPMILHVIRHSDSLDSPNHGLRIGGTEGLKSSGDSILQIRVVRFPTLKEAALNKALEYRAKVVQLLQKSIEEAIQYSARDYESPKVDRSYVRVEGSNAAANQPLDSPGLKPSEQTTSLSRVAPLSPSGLSPSSPEAAPVASPSQTRVLQPTVNSSSQADAPSQRESASDQTERRSDEIERKVLSPERVLGPSASRSRQPDILPSIGRMDKAGGWRAQEGHKTDHSSRRQAGAEKVEGSETLRAYSRDDGPDAESKVSKPDLKSGLSNGDAPRVRIDGPRVGADKAVVEGLGRQLEQYQKQSREEASSLQKQIEGITDLLKVKEQGGDPQEQQVTFDRILDCVEGLQKTQEEQKKETLALFQRIGKETMHQQEKLAQQLMQQKLDQEQQRQESLAFQHYMTKQARTWNPAAYQASGTTTSSAPMDNPVGVTMTINADFDRVKLYEGRFSEDLLVACAWCLQAPQERFLYCGMVKGSVVAQIDIVPDPAGVDMRPCRKLAEDLIAQVAHPFSPVRSAPVTKPAINAEIRPQPFNKPVKPSDASGSQSSSNEAPTFPQPSQNSHPQTIVASALPPQGGILPLQHQTASNQHSSAAAGNAMPSHSQAQGGVHRATSQPPPVGHAGPSGTSPGLPVPQHQHSLSQPPQPSHSSPLSVRSPGSDLNGDSDLSPVLDIVKNPTLDEEEWTKAQLKLGEMLDMVASLEKSFPKALKLEPNERYMDDAEFDSLEDTFQTAKHSFGESPAVVAAPDELTRSNLSVQKHMYSPVIRNSEASPVPAMRPDSARSVPHDSARGSIHREHDDSTTQELISVLHRLEDSARKSGAYSSDDGMDSSIGNGISSHNLDPGSARRRSPPSNPSNRAASVQSDDSESRRWRILPQWSTERPSKASPRTSRKNHNQDREPDQNKKRPNSRAGKTSSEGVSSEGQRGLHTPESRLGTTELRNRRRMVDSDDSDDDFTPVQRGNRRRLETTGDMVEEKLYQSHNPTVHRPAEDSDDSFGDDIFATFSGTRRPENGTEFQTPTSNKYGIRLRNLPAQSEGRPRSHHSRSLAEQVGPQGPGSSGVRSIDRNLPALKKPVREWNV